MTKGPGTGTGNAADRVLEIARVLSTALKAGAAGVQVVTLDLEGLPDIDVSDPTNPQAQRQDGQGARVQDAEPFSSLGAIARPLPPAGGQHALVLCVRAGDELIPIGVADPRLALPGAGPGAGAVGFVGYGGAFYTTQPVDPEDLSQGAIHTVYCPYNIDSQGVAGHAHVIQIHPIEGISVAHADGMALTLHDGAAVLRSDTGAAFISLSGGDVLISGNVKVVGGLQFGGAAGVFPVALVGAPPGTPISGGPSSTASGL